MIPIFHCPWLDERENLEHLGTKNYEKSLKFLKIAVLFLMSSNTFFFQLSPLEKLGIDKNTPPNSILTLSAYAARDVSPGSYQIHFYMALWSSFLCTGLQKLNSLQNQAYYFFLSNILIPLKGVFWVFVLSTYWVCNSTHHNFPVQLKDIICFFQTDKS